MRTTSFRKFFFFFPYRFQPVGPSPRKIRKNKTRTDNNNNKKKRPFKVKNSRSETRNAEEWWWRNVIAVFNLHVHLRPRGFILSFFFLDSFLFLVHLHDASTSIIRLGAFEKRRRPIFFSFGSVGRRHRPTKTKSRRQTKTARAKRKTDIVGHNNGRPTSGERGVKRVTRRQQNYQTRFPECFETKPEDKWNSFLDQKQADESDLYILC